MDRRLALGAALALVVAACGRSTDVPAAVASGSPAADAASPSTATAIATAPVAPSPSSGPRVADASEPSIVIPSTGSLVYTRFPDGKMEVWASCVDLGNVHHVPTPGDLEAGYGAWSPDGQRIAFNGGHDDPDVDDKLEPWDIYTMDRDGGSVTKLTDATALNGDPAWSPDGRLIAYDSTEAGREGIWVMDAADGGNKRRIVPTPEGNRRDYAPRFSSDGTRLVFDREVGEGGDDALWIVNLDGTDLRRLTPPGIAPDKAEWSPDDSRIVFDAFKPGEELPTIWIVDADGQHLTDLMPDAGPNDGFSKPTWSPDGTLIMLVHGEHPGPSKLGLAVMRTDGSGLRWVSDGSGFEHLPDWSSSPC